MTIEGIIFDFDGVLVESEFVGNVHLAATLTALGHPTTVAQSLAAFVGLGGRDFVEAVENWLGRPPPPAFFAARQQEDARVLREGLDPVAGAIAFVRGLPPALPVAIASSSTVHWIETHLRHLGLLDVFTGHIYSGREHVVRGKPAPDVYLHAAHALGIDIARTLIIEDSVVGVTGAVASGGRVVGLAAGQHCGPDHAAHLTAAGAPLVVHTFEAIRALLD